MVGSAVAGALGGFNAHSANIVAAIFIGLYILLLYYYMIDHREIFIYVKSII